MKTRFLTPLLTAAALLAGTAVFGQKNKSPDDSGLKQKHKNKMTSTVLGVYGVHPVQNFFQSRLLQDRFENMADMNYGTAYLPVGDGVHPIALDSLTKKVALADTAFHNSHATNIVIDFIGGLAKPADPKKSCERGYLNGINDTDPALLARDVIGALARGLEAGSDDRVVNLEIWTQDGMKDLHLLGLMPAGVSGVMINLAAERTIGASGYDMASQTIPNPEAFLESEVQLIAVEAKSGTDSNKDREIIAFFVSNEIDATDSSKHKVYAYNLTEMVKHYPAYMVRLHSSANRGDLAPMTPIADLGFMDASVRMTLEQDLKNEEIYTPYVARSGEALLLEALRQNEGYALLNQTVADLQRQQAQSQSLTLENK